MSSALSFDEVYRRYAGRVRTNLHRFGVSSWALDDAVQDVFIVVHRRGFDPSRASMTTWLFGITRRVAADWRRARAREHRRRAACRAQEIDRRHEASTVETRMLVADLLTSIGHTEARIFVLSRVRGVSLARIAGDLGLNRNTAASRLRATRRRLAGLLDADEGRHVRTCPPSAGVSVE